jgi:hypothetical protein
MNKQTVGAYALETFAFLLQLRVFVVTAVNACSFTRSQTRKLQSHREFTDSSQGDCRRSEEVLRSLKPRWPREVEFQWRYPRPNSG